jgi:hypothetical protein
MNQLAYYLLALRNLIIIIFAFSIPLLARECDLQEDLTVARRTLQRSTPSVICAAASALSTTVCVSQSRSSKILSNALPSSDAEESSDDSETDSSSIDSDCSSNDETSSLSDSYGDSAQPATYKSSTTILRSLQSHANMRIRCKTFQFETPTIIPAHSLEFAISQVYEVPVKDTQQGIRSWIVDVDGTITTHAERDRSKYSWELKQRENSVNKIRSIKACPNEFIIFCSAYRTRSDTDRAAIISTLSILKEVGFTNDDLGIGDSDNIIEIDVEIISEIIGRGYIKAYKCGNVVSCKSPSNTEFFFRGKLFAAAIANPQNCNKVEVTSIIDDSKTNVTTFIEDTRFNPYGSDSIVFLPILLESYKHTELTEG